jgi:hypothetical protein
LSRPGFIVQRKFQAALPVGGAGPPQRSAPQSQHLANRCLRDTVVQRHQQMRAIDFSCRMHSFAAKSIQDNPIRR